MFSAINKNFELNQKNKILNFSFGFISLRVNNFFQFFYSVKNILKPKYTYQICLGRNSLKLILNICVFLKLNQNEY